MIDNDVGAYCLQETWQLCDFMLTIRGYTVFHHGMLEKPQKMGRTSAGVMIILNPEMTQVWARAGKLKPLTSLPASFFPGRMIGITLCFPNGSNRPMDTYRRKAKGVIKVFLCSIYHPYKPEEQQQFYPELDHFIANRPRNAEILMGADVNCNVGISSPCFSHMLGPHGIDNRNIKGRELLYIYKTNNLKVLLSFFMHHNYVTYHSFNVNHTAHMLDNIICCNKFSKRISDC